MEPPHSAWTVHLAATYEGYYQRFQRAVYHRTYRRLSRYQIHAVKEEAEDLCQETFQGAYRWMRNFCAAHGECPPAEIFERALKTIEINEYRTYMKRARYPLARVASANGPAADLDGPLPEPETPCRNPDPERELLWKEYQTRIQHCLQKLRSSESSALLCKVVGYSDREVAELLGESEKKIMYSIIPLGRKKLRKCMEGYRNGYRERGV